MSRLSKDTLETIHLAVPEGADVVYIDKVEGLHPIRAFSEIGDRAPNHCSASGKIFLAFHGPSWDQATSRPLKRYTPNTISSVRALEKEVSNVRNQGFAMNSAEWEDGVGGIAAPVFRANGDVVAAIGLVLPLIRYPEGDFSRLIEMVKSAGRDASLALGCTSQALQGPDL
jgi:DNA-binding IclR family transcriptional regulator